MDIEIQPIAQLFSSLGVAGVLGWFLWYKTAIADPKRDEMTLTRMDMMQANHNKTIEKVCTDFTCALKEEREARREELTMLRDDIQQKYKRA